jgi:hypothetical protein
VGLCFSNYYLLNRTNKSNVSPVSVLLFPITSKPSTKRRLTLLNSAVCSLQIFLVVETSLDLVVDDLLGLTEGGLETSVESEESLVADGLLGTSSLGVLHLAGSNAGNLSSFDSLNFKSALGLGVGVKLLHESAVVEGVLVGGLLGDRVVSNGTELALNLVGVDDSGEVGAGHHVPVELVAALLNTLLTVGTEDLVKVGEGVLGEDHESAEVTTGSELEEVESVDTARVDTGEVAGGSLDEGVLVTVDNEGTLGQLEARVSLLVGAGTGRLGGTDSGEVTGGTDAVEGSEEGLGGLNVEGVNDEGELGNVVNVVTSGKNERSNGGGSEG